MSNTVSLFLYIATLSASAALFYFAAYSKRNRTLALLLAVIAIALPVLLGGLRYRVGADFMSYTNKMPYALEMDIVSFSQKFNNMEPAFWILSVVSYWLTSSGILFFFITSFLTIVLLYLAARKIPQANLPLSMALFLAVIFPQSLSGVRQGVAIAAFTYAATFLLERNFTRYILVILFAAMFHYSSIVLVALYPIFWWINTVGKKAIVMRLGISLALLTVTAAIFFLFSKHIPLLDKYTLYFMEFTDKFAYMRGSHNILPEVFFILFIPLFYRGVGNVYFRRLALGGAFLAFIAGVAGFFFPLVGRFSDYFMPLSLIFLSMAPSFFNNRLHKGVAASFVLLFALTFFVGAFFIKGSGSIFPYQFIFLR